MPGPPVGQGQPGRVTDQFELITIRAGTTYSLTVVAQRGADLRGIQVEMARSNAYYGAWAVHTEAAELPVAAAVARISACDAGWFVTKENIQTHGGMGFTWQMDCHLYYRRAKMLALALGGAREWKLRLMAELRKQNTEDSQAA